MLLGAEFQTPPPRQIKIVFRKWLSFGTFVFNYQPQYRTQKKHIATQYCLFY